MIEDKNCIGCRVDCEGHIGTVKYVGTVGDTKGQWLGIDWDDPSRGKHNGTYEGVEYFQTWHSTSGSFIRRGKANFGISCPEAIKVRYGFVDDELAGIDRDNIASVQKSLNAPFVEMVGFSEVNKKQSTFNQLKIVCLNNQCVSSAGYPGELATLCPKVEELDLSHNLVKSWKVIADICVQLRVLLQLNISENCLPIEEEEESIPDDAFTRLSRLTMGRMKYDWCAVIKCLTLFPSIQELIVSYNVIQTIDYVPLHSNIMKITELSLENNLISDWNEVLKLGKLLCLRNLNLNSNKIQEIWFPTNEPTGKTALFLNLSQLHISDNSIDNWRSISELEKLKCLEDLKFRGNPVLQQQSIQTGIQLVIARITTLKYLNGTEIDRSERLGAEYDYLKLFASEWKNTEQDLQKRKEFIMNHPRFPSLIERIGVPDTPEIKNTQLSSNVITVEFICPEDPNIKRIKKKLLKNMDVQKLMGIVQRLFKIHGKIPVLSFVRPTVSEDEIPLDKPLQELSYYLIDDGDLILVRW